MFEKLFLFCKGYLILRLNDISKERFLNLCKTRKIEIIDIVNINNTFFCKMSCKDFFKIRPLVHKTKCYPKIERKLGLPFLIRNLRKRKGLLIGMFLGAVILSQCTERIWYIDVQGGFLHTRQQMVQVLKEELGICAGMGREQVDCLEIEKQIRLIYNEIGWVSVERRGCNLYIRLNESAMPKSEEEQEQPCHMIAQRDGIVRGVEVLSGIPKVKPGDYVKEGDILISGVVPIVDDYGEIITLHPVGATGKVYLETDFTYQAVYPMTYEEKIETDRKMGVGFFWYKTKLFSYIPRYSEGKYDIITFDMVPFVFRDYEVPFLIRIYESKAYITEKRRMSEEETEEKAFVAYRSFLSDWETQGIQIVKEQVSFNTGEQFFTLKADGLVCGNFISYQRIQEEEWKIEDEYLGDNP